MSSEPSRARGGGVCVWLRARRVAVVRGGGTVAVHRTWCSVRLALLAVAISSVRRGAVR